jgi:TM2 domain-containing membrane protein YozV
MATCADCGTRLPEVANFCWACGKSLQDLPRRWGPLDGHPDGIRPLMLFLAGRKSLEVTYLLWLLFGFLGAHRFYTGRYLAGSLMIGLLLVGFSGVGVWYNAEYFATEVLEIWLACGLAALITGLLWLLLDLFLIPDWIRTYNRKLIDRLEPPGDEQQ